MALKVSAASDDFLLDTKTSRLCVWPPQTGPKAAGMVTFGNAILRLGARLASRRASLIPTNAGFVAAQQLVTKAVGRRWRSQRREADFRRYFFNSWLRTTCLG